MTMSKLLGGFLATTITLAPMAALSQPPKWAPGHKNSAAQFAPGQVKKRHAHDDYLKGDWQDVTDYRQWGLTPPPAGHRYVRKDGQILEVVKNTLAIVGAVAVVDALLD
ncbi:RcnB family protein [Phaeobacter sp. HF9A]|uniref:RcnB family protein n=1 Tax=Phaeobacter sp. HF9A TaxID=2721561 RepID=UPI001431D8FF|nr:hypothetical protein [Phaeobacter sp. HF9A]NIZ15480.1 hypothetical protein [Phaeobacter sp. HF9A]